jgi:hypothetical protein
MRENQKKTETVFGSQLLRRIFSQLIADIIPEIYDFVKGFFEPIILL